MVVDEFSELVHTRKLRCLRHLLVARPASQKHTEFLRSGRTGRLFTITKRLKRPIWFCSWRTFRALASYTIAVAQGLEGYSRDPGFDQNTVWGSGKRKIS